MLVGPDFRYSLSFSCHVTSKLAKKCENDDFHAKMTIFKIYLLLHFSAILNLIVAYESMGQYLNLVGTDFRYSLLFSCHVTSKFAKTALPSGGYIFSTGHGKSE